MRRPIRRERMRDMTRSAAREIAVHFTFELGFSDLSADQLLERYMLLKGSPEQLAAMDSTQRSALIGLQQGTFGFEAVCDIQNGLPTGDVVCEPGRLEEVLLHFIRGSERGDRQ